MAGDRSWSVGLLRGLAGAVVGGAIGYLAFFWLAKQGLYAIVLPGTLVGLGFGALSGRRSLVDGVVCAVLAGLFGLFVDWQFSGAGSGFAFFVTHAREAPRVKRILIAVGALLAFWFGQGRKDGPWRQSTTRSTSGAE